MEAYFAFDDFRDARVDVQAALVAVLAATRLHGKLESARHNAQQVHTSSRQQRAHQRDVHVVVLCVCPHNLRQELCKSLEGV